MSLWRYLLAGSDALVLPRDWMSSRLTAYEDYTRRQLDQGSIVRGHHELAAENARIVAEREQRLAAMQPSRVVRFRRQGER